MIGLEQFFLDGDKPPSRAKRIGRVLLTLAGCGILIAIAFVEHRKAAKLDGWTKIPCQILESKVDSRGTGRWRERPYHVWISFEYLANGRKQIGREFKLNAGGTDDAAEAYAAIRQFPQGLNTVCYVNPLDASQAVLLRPSVLEPSLFLAGVIVGTGALLWFYCIPQLGLRGPGRSDSSGADRKKSVAIVFAVALLFVFSAAGIHWYLIPLSQHFASLTWPATPCRVVEANIVSQEMGAEVPLTVYRTDIHYVYEVSGVEYHSNRFSFTEGSTLLAFARERALREFPAGRTAWCFADPRDPGSAVLVRRLSPGFVNAGYPLSVALLAGFVLKLRGDDAKATAVLRVHRRMLITLGIAIALGVVLAQFLQP